MTTGRSRGDAEPAPCANSAHPVVPKRYAPAYTHDDSELGDTSVPLPQ